MGLIDNIKDAHKAKQQAEEMTKKSFEAFEELIAHLKRIDKNVIITHENQMEINVRLSKIEEKLDIAEYNPNEEIVK